MGKSANCISQKQGDNKQNIVIHEHQQAIGDGFFRGGCGNGQVVDGSSGRLEDAKNSAGIHDAHQKEQEKHHTVANAARYGEKTDGR